ncbi:DUF1754-domain-containing protein [Caenorhabditis elegans]|uniref:DUF1754-domain-containing protein n=1 Tax=Caenorhabditis elegans TaxID=6239 RepID=H2KZ83_CAEEL|nr:DUF1754-domain-containing protein [Caenorhabditis elegans]CCD66928.1 DUF1754-domain-containing protein [Caenorhabditis elegans]|eukprot:NP_491947.1 Uncharacterized protein CELE_C37A2.8 [Caenorhabditis elegans]
MATFASRELTEEDDSHPGPSEKSEKDVLGIVRTGPKKLITGESSSLFKLKNELLKRKDRLNSEVHIKHTETHVSGKSVEFAEYKKRRKRASSS